MHGYLRTVMVVLMSCPLFSSSPMLLLQNGGTSFQIFFVPVENFKGKNTLSKVSSLLKEKLSENVLLFLLILPD